MTRGVGGQGPANIMKHLKRIVFPADKDRILEVAGRGPGPDTRKVMEILAQIPDRKYYSPAEIVREVSRLKRFGQATDKE